MTEIQRRRAVLVYVHLDADDGPDPEMLDDLAGCAPAPTLLRVAS